MRGTIYIMTTAVSGLIKIGQTSISNYQERMRNLEANGYYNVSGLKRFFAIELEDYNDKEILLKEIFSNVCNCNQNICFFHFFNYIGN